MGWSWRSITKPFEEKTIRKTFNSGKGGVWRGTLAALSVSNGPGYGVADNAAQNATIDAIKKYIGKPDEYTSPQWDGFASNFDKIQNDLAQQSVIEANAAQEVSVAARNSAIGVGILLAVVAAWFWWKKRKRI